MLHSVGDNILCQRPHLIKKKKHNESTQTVPEFKNAFIKKQEPTSDIHFVQSIVLSAFKDGISLF